AYLLGLIQIYNLFSGFLLFRTASLQMSDEPDFFLENYARPVYENGIILKDMIMLRKELFSPT
ncbi:hypothetical protein EII14_07760, partial [Alloprevotella sp. OH1205_COT-284]